MKKPKYCIDTNIFVGCFRGNEDMADFLAGLENKTTSVVTVMELYEFSKSRGREEIERVKTYMEEEKVNILPITSKASKIALKLMEKYAPTGLGVKDSLIAATCLSKNLPLATADKDFDIISKKERLKIIKLMGFER